MNPLHCFLQVLRTQTPHTLVRGIRRTTFRFTLCFVFSSPTFAAVTPLTPPSATAIQTPATENSQTGTTSATIATIPEKTLSDAVQGYLGINADSAPENQNLLTRAQQYLQLRKRPGVSRLKSEILKSCTPHPENTPFCLETAELQLNPAQTQKHHRQNKNLLKRNSQKHAEWLRTGSLEKIEPLTEEELREAFKRLQSVSQLEPLAKQVLQSSHCSTPELNWLLGYKTEEFLPDESAKQMAIELYEKAAKCQPQVNEASLKIRLRLSLLKIWDNHCYEALPHLEFLTEHSTPTTDLGPRALFWQYQCGVQLKKPDLMTKSRKALSQRYPFSLQTVLTQFDTTPSGPTYSSKSDSPVQIRLKDNPALNTRMRAIEALIKLKEPRYAKDLLTQLDSQIDQTPARFRLYVAALYDQVDESIRQFKLLSSVFREDPNLISRSALQLFYPHHSNLTQGNQTGTLDSMLLLSLIRQESAFNTRARSPAGAMGLMQVMPKTARRFFKLRSPNQLYNPKLNLEVGSRYFSNLMKSYGGDAELALAAYNAGPKRVEEWLKRYPVKDRALFLDLIPFKETREYVSSIARNYFWYVSLYSDRLHEPTEGKKNLGKVFNLFKS